MNDKLISRREIIISGNLWRSILLLSVPVVFNNFINAMYNLIDTLFVANIGSLEIAAITFVGPINTLVRAISDGLAIGGTTLIAREIGRENYQKAKLTSLILLSIAVGLGILIGGSCFIFSKQILITASATSSLLDIANTYFRITVLSAPLIFINSAFLAIKRSNGDTLKSMNINFIAMGVKVITTYIFIFYMNMGIQSLAISTIIGNLLVTLYATYDLFIRKSIMKLSFNFFKFNKKVLTSLLIIGIPVMLERSSISFSFILVNKYVIQYGEKVLAAYGVTNRINSLFFSMVTGFGTGLAPIVSQNLGIGNVDRVKDSIKKTFIIALIVSTSIVSVVLPFKEFLANIFSKGDEEVLYHITNAISVYSVSVIPWAVFQVTNGVFQGTGHTKYNLIISFARIYCFRLPLVIILSKYFKLSEYSIWYSMLFSNLLTGLFAFILYLKNYKQLKLVGE